MTTTITATPSTTREAEPARRVPRVVHYFLHSLAAMLREWGFLAFIIALPVVMYLLFSSLFGDQTGPGGVDVKSIMMVSMATYGGLGAALNAGAVIQTERSSGWFRQLMLTPLTPSAFLGAKVATALCAIAPAILAVLLAGVIRGVRMPLATWAQSFGLILVALLPMVVMGLVIGLWFKQQTATAVTTLSMLGLAIIGGLWMPLEMMPGWLQTVGRLSPSFWAGEIGRWPLVGGDFPWQGALVIGSWFLVLVVLGALGYRRAVSTSRR